MSGSPFRTLLACLLLSLSLSSHAAEPSVVLSPREEQLSRQAGLERSILLIIKEESSVQLHRLNGYDDKGFQIMARGIVVSVPDVRTKALLAVLRTKLRPWGVMVFIIESNESIKSDKIGFLKGTDQYEILRVMQTNGDESNISHEDVIERLKAWEEKYPFDIIGAEHDWVEIEFRVLPKNLRTFAEEVYEFCPDTVEDDGGTVQDLVLDIQATKRLVLSWN